jgi:hypothetical protein
MRSARLFCASIVVFVSVASLISATGCGSKVSNGQHPDTPVTVSLQPPSVVVPQDGSMVQVQATIGSTSETAVVSFAGLPAGVQAAYSPTATSPSGAISFTASSTAFPGSYTPTVNVNSAGQSVSANFTMVIAPVVKVGNTVDTALGVKGKFEQFMATSFQIFQYTGEIFGTGATTTAREQQLTNLGAQHNRMQVIAGGTPMVSNTGTAADWDFTILDTTAQPVLASGDHSPEFQIGTAPAWMCDSQGHLLVATHAKDFAAYAANLVRYYNKGGFDIGGKHFQSPGNYPITWWGIFNEYNINGLSASDYVTLYNATVPAMLAVDPAIRISAFEFSDFGLGTGDSGDPMQSLPTFLADPKAGGVNTQVDVLSTHFYGSCNQSDTDADLFAQVPQFADNVSYFYKTLANRPDLASTQVWVTENNVNADYSDANGKSTCNPGQRFVTDQRGTSPFFAAWRPYVFSQLGKAGNRALYQWEYAADQQYGEVDSASDTFLSYWVDRTLINMFPSTPAAPGADILTLTTTDSTSLEALATRSADGTVRVMVVDRAVHAPSDNNGAGDARTVIVDTSSFGTFGAASVLTIDASTNITNGPTSAGIPPASRIPVTLNGYGTAFLTLTP